MTVVFAVGVKNAMAANRTPKRYALVMNTATGVRTVTIQHTPMIDTYGGTFRCKYGAIRVPRNPPTPAIAAMMPICPDGTPLALARMMMMM